MCSKYFLDLYRGNFLAISLADTMLVGMSAGQWSLLAIPQDTPTSSIIQTAFRSGTRKPTTMILKHSLDHRGILHLQFGGHNITLI